MNTKSRTSYTYHPRAGFGGIVSNAWIRSGYSFDAMTYLANQTRTISDSPTGATWDGLVGYSSQACDSSVLTGSSGKGENPCIHDRTKMWLHQDPFQMDWVVYSGANLHYKATLTLPNGLAEACRVQRNGLKWNLTYFGGSYVQVPTWSSNFPTNWESLYSTEALSVMWPGVKAEMSILNFLWEIPEIKLLAPQIKSAVATLKDKTPRIWRKLRYASWGVASTWLLYSFGLRPLITDINGVLRGIQGIKRQVERLEKYEGKVLTSYFRKNLSPPSDLVYAPAGWVPIFGQSAWGWEENQVRTTSWPSAYYSAKMTYRYTFTPYQRYMLAVNVLFDSLGFKPNAEIIWDAIPFSFVLDWLFKVGDFLERYGGQQVSPSVEILDFVHSRKEKRRIMRTVQYRHRAATSVQTQVLQVGYEDQTSYARKRFIPSLWSVSQIDTSRLDLREAILGGALLRTRIKK